MSVLLNWYSVVASLKQQTRRGWTERGLKGDSIADHSFGCLVVGWLLAQREVCDAPHLYELLIVHELVMAKMADVTPASGQYASKESLEREAAVRVGSLLEEPDRMRYLALMSEYLQGISQEAILAREAAKLETLLQGEAYEIANGRSDIIPSLLTTYADLFSTPTGRTFLHEIRRRSEERQKTAGG